MKKLILVLSLLFSPNLLAEEAISILWNNLAPGPKDLPAETNVNLELDGKKVIIPGFIVPLDGQNSGYTKNFLLTPQQGACFHKPPSAPNQLIHVAFDVPIAIPDLEQPMYIAGTISIKSAQAGFAKTGYHLKGIEAIAYPVQVSSSAAAHNH
ncbi:MULTISPECIES: DUF3299 domain-containing protein [unclassified Shewanella]|uniref:DUF3299 domain-containing protein n=1 Tax=unclassified Shewanella TaxID=196818 RepID=UPI001BB93EC1|nr:MULTISPECIES: DUF3299 domain-containing protein [unclassified Shewanella]GIU20014.1 DUF3299 domain-containing protein [Shewanella sp. MBTL60-112-B1]GIU34379.1 DUF3299 domain-containing protein [Shewanella sp. MBTL60-112-B2]